MDTTFLDWATAYAKSLNWFVFPLAPRGKTPITPNGFKDASNDPERIRAWWTQTPQANIGVDCGRSNLAVIDLDGAHALDRWNVIVDSMGLPFARCAVAQTGGGGNHIVYAQPSPRIRNTSGKLGKGIDTRGDGGYIVLAPSIHPSGNRYEWLNEQEPEYGLDPMPDQLADLILNTPLPPAAEAKPTPTTMNGELSLQRAYERIANASEGTRNEIINKATWYLYGLVREGKLIEQDVWSVVEMAAQRCGYPQGETKAVLRSIAGKR
jgi:hypothetical protein